MTLIAIRLIDRAGHEPLLAGIAGMVLSLTVLGFPSLLLPQPSNPTDPQATIITPLCLAANRCIRQAILCLRQRRCRSTGEDRRSTSKPVAPSSARAPRATGESGNPAVAAGPSPPLLETPPTASPPLEAPPTGIPSILPTVTVSGNPAVTGNTPCLIYRALGSLRVLIANH